MPYLAVRSNTYFLRVAIPRSLQPLLGYGEIFQSLNTSDRDEARILALSLTSELLLKFTEWKAAMKKKAQAESDDILSIGILDADGIPRVRAPVSRVAKPPPVNAGKFELDVLPNGRPYIKQSQPGEDNLNAKEALRMAQEAAMLPAAPKPQPIPQSTPEPSKQAVEAAASVAAKVAKDEIAGVLEKLAGIQPRNIHGAFTDFIADLVAKKRTSVRHYKSGVDHFIKWITQQHPNLQVHKVSKSHMAAYRKLLESIKSHKSPFQPLHPHNIYKRMGFVETFFRFCQSKEWMPAGDIKLPTYGLKGTKPDYDSSETSYEAFTHPELKKIFNPKTYQCNLEAPHKFWGPLLGLFTGMRRGEIVNIHPDSINNDNTDKTWLITIGKKVKNKNSKRTIPLHQKLIDLGFLEYLEDLRKIFPKAEGLFPYTWNMNKIFGEDFAAYCDKADVISPTKVFHSFRKNVAHTLLMAGVVEERYREHYIGHLRYKLHEAVYSGRANPMRFYSTLINTHLQFNLDLAPLKYQRGMFDPLLLDEKWKQDRKKLFPRRSKTKTTT